MAGWPEILWGEVPAGNDPTDVFPWLRRRPRQAAPPRRSTPRRSTPRRSAPRQSAPLPRTPSMPGIEFPEWLLRQGAGPAQSPSVPSQAAPMPSIYRAPVPAGPPPVPDNTLGRWVRDHYGDAIERSVYDKLLARGFQPPGPWESPTPQAGYADFGPGGRVTLGPRTRIAGVKMRRKKANRALRDGYVDFR